MEHQHLVPQQMFLTKGVGRHVEKLASFELALRKAGIAAYNIVGVSSIYPPHCKIITKSAGLKKLQTGQIGCCSRRRRASDIKAPRHLGGDRHRPANRSQRLWLPLGASRLRQDR